MYIDEIPEDLPDEDRFILSSVRIATQRLDVQSMCAFVYSEAARHETESHGFARAIHMKDGHGDIAGCIVVTNRDANNGMSRICAEANPAAIMDELEDLGFDEKCTVIWDPSERVATVYRNGVSSIDKHIRSVIGPSNLELTEDEVFEALEKTYSENLCNPSARTAKLYEKNKLIGRAEDEIERHLKGQLTMYFLGQARPIKILSQTNMKAGRADLMFLQRSDSSGPRMIGVLELKVLRGPEKNDWNITKEGLSQGYHYKNDLQLPFAILALFDVAKSPSNDVDPLLKGQEQAYVDIVPARRYPIHDSPQAWRNAGGDAAI